MASSLDGQWTLIKQVGGRGAGKRIGHSVATIGNHVYSFGGEFPSGRPVDTELYVFDLEGKTWSVAPNRGDVPTYKCSGAGMVAVGSKLYVFGGRDEQNNFNDFYSYDTLEEKWKLLTVLSGKGVPKPRAFPSMASDGKHVYVYGGEDNEGNLCNSFEAFGIDNGDWKTLPRPKDKTAGAGLHVVQEKIWALFGDGNDGESNQVRYYDMSKKTWNEVYIKGLNPPARSMFASAAVGNYIIIFGGKNGDGTVSGDGYALDTSSEPQPLWETLRGANPPLPRGWAASTTATIVPNKGLLMHGGTLVDGTIVDDIYFYQLN